MSQQGRDRGRTHERLVQQVDAPAWALRVLAYHDPLHFPVLLDSSAAGPLGRYSILAAYPQAALWSDRLGVLHWRGSLQPPVASGFLDALQDAWASEARWGAGGLAPGDASSAAPGPFSGGWMVFLGYELAQEIEPRLTLPLGAWAAEPMALALRVGVVLLFDHQTEHAYIVAEPRCASLAEELRAVLGRLPEQPLPAETASPIVTGLQEEAPALFRGRVAAALEYIRAGDIYQANLSRLWQAQLQSRERGPHAASPLALLYERLRTSNPAPFAALLQFGDWGLLSSSPERLVAARGGAVVTRPIAGTRPRSRQHGADADEIAGLIAHPKERAEHVMLIDLERNDLGRVCEPGSVRVDEFMIAESYAHVHHIVSNVCGELRPRLTPVDVLRAVFPGGTITGCPKFRCMQIIAELEASARGAYTGALGYINHDGSMDFNILIRTFSALHSQLRLRAGAGIVAESLWERELAETRAKARGLLAALQTPHPTRALQRGAMATPS